MIQNERERGWVAGLLEGEGCFIVVKESFKRKDGTHQLAPRVQLKMTDRDVVERFANLVEYKNKITTFYPKGNHKPTYTVVIRGNLAIELMLVVRDLMGERRRQKIDEILATDFDLRYKKGAYG
jgi:hypothetical protein